jgi:hypothetical protein
MCSCLIYVICICLRIVQHILCSVFVLFVLVLFILCCQLLWIVHYWLPLRYFLTFIKQSIGHIWNVFSKLYRIDNLQVTISVWKFLMMASCKEIVYMSGLVHNCNVHLIWQTDYNGRPRLDTFHTSHLQKYFLTTQHKINRTVKQYKVTRIVDISFVLEYTYVILILLSLILAFMAIMFKMFSPYSHTYMLKYVL